MPVHLQRHYEDDFENEEGHEIIKTWETKPSDAELQEALHANHIQNDFESRLALLDDDCFSFVLMQPDGTTCTLLYDVDSLPKTTP